VYSSPARIRLQHLVPTQGGLIDKVESVQRQLTKLIPALHELSCRDRLSALNLESLEHRHLRLDLFNV